MEKYRFVIYAGAAFIGVLIAALVHYVYIPALAE